MRQHATAAQPGNSQYFLHGTTVGLNALLERRGATVGLLCTSGFHDALETRRGNPRGEVTGPVREMGIQLPGAAERDVRDGVVTRDAAARLYPHVAII